MYNIIMYDSLLIIIIKRLSKLTLEADTPVAKLGQSVPESLVQ